MEQNFILVKNKITNCQEINNDNLLNIGFKKNFSENEKGFYSLDINNEFKLTISFKTMTVSLHKKNIGHIIEFKKINTILDIENLIEIIE